MKSVKFPGRKMFIVSSLQPSEEATGGAWFTDGVLDKEFMDQIALWIEIDVSRNSWREVDRAPAESHNKQRNANKKSYEPFAPGHNGYPTLKDITKAVFDAKVSQQPLPENAIAQLLEVMVYDDRLFKMRRIARQGEVPDGPESDEVTMFRCFSTPNDLTTRNNHERRLRETTGMTLKNARRQQELEDIGSGGASEVPCMRCPVSEECEDGGPVNANTCVYFAEWYEKQAVADEEDGRPWPGRERKIKIEPYDKKGKGREVKKEDEMDVD